MAQLEKTVYTIDRDPVVVESNPSATWFAGLLIALVVVIIGVFMMLINTSNNENAAELQKMQEEQSSLQQQQSSLNSSQAVQNEKQFEQTGTDARQQSKQSVISRPADSQAANDATGQVPAPQATIDQRSDSAPQPLPNP